MTMPLATFGNFFGPDMLIIFLIILVLFGAKKLPELARGLGQSLNEFKKAREDFEHELRQGQKDVQVREAADRQPYAPAAAVPAHAAALPYTPAIQPSTPESEAALQQRIAELEQKLHAAQEQGKPAATTVL